MLELRSVSLTLANGNGEAKEVLHQINFKLEPGKFYTITGPNGGGKTSLAKLIMGVYKPTAGRIYYKGEDITELNITERSRRGIVYAFQQSPRFKGIRVRNLLDIAASKALKEKDYHYLLHEVGLCPEEYLEREVDASLSGGEMKRIEIATLLARESSLLIFDEPEAGIDLWAFRHLVRAIVEQHQLREKATSIVITHNERFLSVADEVFLVAEGEIKKRGRADQIWPLIRDQLACEWKQTCGGEHRDINCYR